MLEDTQRRLAAIVAADVVGYSRLMGVDEAKTLDTLRRHRRDLIDPTITEHRGRIVKTMGDGLLMEFPSVVNAVNCAVGIQEGMARQNANSNEDDRLQFRIGIHLGDIIVEGDDIFGDGVNVASRIESLAEPDGVAISDDAHRLVRDRLDLTWQDGGEHQVKNIARAIWIWRWPSSDTQPSQAALDALPQTVPDSASIAVLPFDNMSGDSDQSYFADGISEDIITELSRTPGLLVISRNSTFTYKGKSVKTQEVCSDLGVRYVLEGSVRRAGSQVRVSAQLIDGRSGGHIWAQRYDRALNDIFAVQDDVTAKIVEALEIKLSASDSKLPPRAETDSPEAYDCVLRGREQYNKFSKEGHAKAKALYEHALELDENYAAAYASLAHIYIHEWLFGSREALERASELAERAKLLNPNLSLVYMALSGANLFSRQHDEAIEDARKLIEIEPGSADSYANLAGTVMFAGAPDQTVALIEKAVRLNPFYPAYYDIYVGLAHLILGQAEDAIEALNRSIVRNPDSMYAHIYLASSYGHIGDLKAARASFYEAKRLFPDLSAQWFETYLPFKNPKDAQSLQEGLKKAGLAPELETMGPR
ncbi:MAG: adenylate/guanylate cyclase domain-containing protein [Pseudomonadota bacterium]